MLIRLGILLALSEWRERRARTLITMSGVSLAVLSIMLILLISTAFQDAFTRQVQSFNADWVYITSEDKATGPPLGYSILTRDDVKRVKRVHGVQDAWPVILLTTTLEDGTNSVLRIIPARRVKDRYDFAEEGRLITRHDAGRKVIMIGSQLAEDANLKPGQTLPLLNTTWKIIGIIPRQGEAREDTSIILPYETYEKLIGEDRVSLIIAQTPTPQETAKRIEHALERVHENIIVLTQDDAVKRVQRMLSLLNAIILSILGVSMLISSLGIANNLTSSIMQRKRLIGTLRALGMTKQQLMLILLTETSLLTITATLLGVLLSIPLATLSLHHLSTLLAMPLTLTLPPKSILLILTITLATSLTASIIPTRQALTIPPAEAVRYE